MKTLEIIKPGAIAILGDGVEEFEGTIDAAKIDAALNVFYSIEWWSGRDRKQAWFSPSQFKIRPSRTAGLKIGFSNQEK